VRANRLLLALLLFCTVILSAGCGTPTPSVREFKAAIIDQLYLRQPNTEFVTQSKTLLESLGLKVDIWQGNDITVDFYRKLPSMGYRFVLLRVHSGTILELSGDNQTKELPYTYLFTAEKYSTSKYVPDQLSDRVAYAIMEEDTPEVFAVNSQFVRGAKGNFDNTFILSMGCESFRHDDLQQAFIAKGASMYIGWSDIVTLEHVDKVTLALLQDFCTGNTTIQRGVEDVTARLGVDPYFGSFLKFFPVEKATQTFKEILQ
jgi:hypothetical protein